MEHDPAMLKHNVMLIKELVESEPYKRSPIDLNITKTKVLPLPQLCFCNYEIMPKKMKLTNSGTTAILSAKWLGERPYIRGGPLIGKYVFSQLHFHWGATAMDGSEHTVEGASKPLEMHAIHFKAKYEEHEKSLKHKDGIISLVYFFDMTSKDNPLLAKVVDKLISVQIYDTVTPLELFPLNELVYPFTLDYFVYAGDVENNAQDCIYTVLWIISRDITLISINQLKKFRLLLDPYLRPIRRNYRDVITTDHPFLDQCELFHVHPGNPLTNSTLSPVPLPCQDEFCEDFENIEDTDSEDMEDESTARKSSSSHHHE